MTYHKLVDIIDGCLVLNEATFAATVGNRKYQGQKVSLVSTIGKSRTGKSFLTACLSQYDPIKTDMISGPFSTGFEPETKGIQILEQPLLKLTQNGEKVHVFLLDTQGLFLNDCDGFISESIMIFTMLISEVLIFNLSARPDGDDLRTLYRAVEISSNLVNRRPINNLLFLIRDAMVPDAPADELLRSIWDQTENSKELTEACTVIRQNIVNIGCVLACAPSEKVRKASYSVRLADLDDRKFLDGIVKVRNWIEMSADGSLMEKLELSFWKGLLERIAADLPKMVRGTETTKSASIQRAATKLINEFDLHCAGTTVESVSQFYLAALEEIKQATSKRSLEVNHIELIAEIAKRLQVLHDNDMSNVRRRAEVQLKESARVERLGRGTRAIELLRSIRDAEEFWRNNGIAKEAGSDVKTYEDLKERFSAWIRYQLLPNHIRDLVDKREPTLQSLVQTRTRIAEIEDSKFLAMAVEAEISFLKASVKKLEPMYVCSPQELIDIVSTATSKVERCFERAIMKRKNELIKLQAPTTHYVAAAAKKQFHHEARIEGTGSHADPSKPLIGSEASVPGAGTNPPIPPHNASNSERGVVASKQASYEEATTVHKSGTHEIPSSVAFVPSSNNSGTAHNFAELKPRVTSANQMLLHTENMTGQTGIHVNSKLSSGARSDQGVIINNQQIKQENSKTSQSGLTTSREHLIKGLTYESKQPNKMTREVKRQDNYTPDHTDHNSSEQLAEIALLSSQLAKLQEEKAAVDSKHGKCYVEIRDLKETCARDDEIHKNLIGFRQELRKLVRENRKYDFLILEVRDELLRIEMERCLDRDSARRGESIYQKLHEQRGHVVAHSYELATDITFGSQRIFFGPVVSRALSNNNGQYHRIDEGYGQCFQEIENALHAESMHCRSAVKTLIVKFQTWLMGWQFPFSIELSICYSFQINAEELLRKSGKGMPYVEEEAATKSYREFIDAFNEQLPKDHQLSRKIYTFCSQEMDNIMFGYPNRYPMAVATKLSQEFCRRALKDCSRQLPEKATWMWDSIYCLYIYKWAGKIHQLACIVEKEKPPRGLQYFSDMLNYVTKDMSSETGDQWKAKLIRILEPVKGRRPESVKDINKAVKDLQESIQTMYVALSPGY